MSSCRGIIYEYEDGGVYCGEWEKDSSHGHGCGTGPGGRGRFEGLWAEGGQVSGVYTWPHSGMRYMGTWKDNKRHGHGKEIREDGTEYCGEYVRGARGPYGVMKLPNSVFRGSWRNGKQDGEGEEVYLDGGKQKRIICLRQVRGLSMNSIIKHAIMRAPASRKSCLHTSLLFPS